MEERDQQPLFKNSLENGFTAVLLMTGAGIIVFTLAGISPVYDYFEAGYRTRDFTMWERVLTQPRVLAFHFSQLFWPVSWRLSLAHDVVISTSLLQPMTTLPVILALLGNLPEP